MSQIGEPLGEPLKWSVGAYRCEAAPGIHLDVANTALKPSDWAWMVFEVKGEGFGKVQGGMCATAADARMAAVAAFEEMRNAK